MADINEKIGELTNTPDNTADFDQNDIQQNKTMGILAYISWLVLVPIFAAKGSKFARFHANQGLVLAIVGSIAYTLMFIGGFNIILFLLTGLVGWALSIVCTVFMVLGIVNAARGLAKELPLIGKIKILK